MTHLFEVFNTQSRQEQTIFVLAHNIDDAREVAHANGHVLYPSWAKAIPVEIGTPETPFTNSIFVLRERNYRGKVIQDSNKDWKAVINRNLAFHSA